MIRKELKEIYNVMCRANDRIIEAGESPVGTAFLIKKGKDWSDLKTVVMAMIFQNRDEKYAMKMLLKQIIIKTKVDAYMVFFDTKMTEIDQKTQEKKVHDAIIRILYTPEEKIFKIIKYKENKILEVMDLTDKYDSCSDTWDVWREPEEEISDEVHEEYQKFKKEHPEFYEGTEGSDES